MHRFSVDLSRARFFAEDLGERMGRDVLGVLARRDALLVFNGGFFGLERENEGLLVDRGRTLTPWSARIGGGVLAVRRGVARLHDGEAEPPRDVLRSDFAIQCRPRLVVGGRVNVRSDDGRMAHRTALCIRDGGRTVDVVIARSNDDGGRGAPALRAFAERLSAAGCEEALNLDGGPSTGAAWTSASGPSAAPPVADVRMLVFVKNTRNR